MDQPLKFETHGTEGSGYWFRLYECPHVTENTFPIALVLALGPNTNLLLCRHCWQQAKGLAAEEMLTNHFQSLPWTTKPQVVHKMLNPDEPVDETSAEYWEKMEDLQRHLVHTEDGEVYNAHGERLGSPESRERSLQELADYWVKGNVGSAENAGQGDVQ